MQMVVDTSSAILQRTKGLRMIADLPQLWSDEERWHVLMENVKDFGIFMLDASGRIATWNIGAKRLLGYSADEVLGQPFSLIFTEPDQSQEQPQFELREAETKGRCEDERWHVRRDGTQFWASGVLTPLWAPDGALRGFAKVLRDITERKLSEVASADANRRKDEFMAVLSHEFRNPLAAILNAAKLLGMDTEMSEISREATSIIERQADALAHMVDDLLDVSRIIGGKLQLQRERVKLSDILDRAIEVAHPMVEARRHQLKVVFSSEAIWIDGDPRRLQQVFSNLLVNAAKYTDPGGDIRVSVEREGNFTIVRVVDNGAGILSEMLPRIFEPFVQADRSLDRSQGGLGIGLALVRRLLELHGGKAEAFSEGIGKGSEFVVQLPAVAEIATLKSSENLEPTLSRSAGLSILIAEDNPDTAESMAMILRKFNHQVKVVHSGTEVLSLTDQNSPQVVILDIGLPGMDGYRIASTLAQKSVRPTCVIAITGYGQPDDIERSKQSGFDHHFVKPVDFAALIKLLEGIASSV